MTVDTSIVLTNSLLVLDYPASPQTTTVYANNGPNLTDKPMYQTSTVVELAIIRQAVCKTTPPDLLGSTGPLLGVMGSNLTDKPMYQTSTVGSSTIVSQKLLDINSGGQAANSNAISKASGQYWG